MRGEIYSLPSTEGVFGDPKGERPHIVVSLREVDAEMATVVYCSTKDWELSPHGPPHVVIDPSSSSTFRATGLSRRTIAYPGRLALCLVADLTDQCGVLMDEMPQLDTELLRAIGFRTGVSRSRGEAASGSWRGAVVRFKEDFAQHIGMAFGLIVSDPIYSRERMFQNFVPLLSYEEVGDSSEGVDVEVETLMNTALRMRAIHRLVQSCTHDFNIEAPVGHISAEAMRAVEDQLAVRFFGSVIAAETASL